MRTVMIPFMFCLLLGFSFLASPANAQQQDELTMCEQYVRDLVIQQLGQKGTDYAVLNDSQREMVDTHIATEQEKCSNAAFRQQMNAAGAAGTLGNAGANGGGTGTNAGGQCQMILMPRLDSRGVVVAEERIEYCDDCPIETVELPLASGGIKEYQIPNCGNGNGFGVGGGNGSGNGGGSQCVTVQQPILDSQNRVTGVSEKEYCGDCAIVSRSLPLARGGSSSFSIPDCNAGRRSGGGGIIGSTGGFGGGTGGFPGGGTEGFGGGTGGTGGGGTGGAGTDGTGNDDNGNNGDNCVGPNCPPDSSVTPGTSQPTPNDPRSGCPAQTHDIISLTLDGEKVQRCVSKCPSGTQRQLLLDMRGNQVPTCFGEIPCEQDPFRSCAHTPENRNDDDEDSDGICNLEDPEDPDCVPGACGGRDCPTEQELQEGCMDGQECFTTLKGIHSIPSLTPETATTEALNMELRHFAPDENGVIHKVDEQGRPQGQVRFWQGQTEYTAEDGTVRTKTIQIPELLRPGSDGYQDDQGR